MVIMRLEFNEKVAKAVMSATAQQPLEIWTVFQPEAEFYITERKRKFTDEDTIDSFVKPGRVDFNIGTIDRRAASFFRKDDAIAHARNILKEAMEGVGSGYESRKFESEPGQGMTHGIFMDQSLLIHVRLVSIVKSILPVADT